MFYVIQTNINKKDFQSRIIKIEDLNWEEFKNKIINHNLEINNATMRGHIFPRAYSKIEIVINDKIHFQVKFKIYNGEEMIFQFYKIPKENFNIIK